MLKVVEFMFAVSYVGLAVILTWLLRQIDPGVFPLRVFVACVLRVVFVAYAVVWAVLLLTS